MKIEGPFKFSVGVPCKAEVLGKQYSTRIGNTTIEIVFPCAPMQDSVDGQQGATWANSLLPPNGKKYIILGEELYWGCPRQYPKENSIVNAVLFSMECEEQEVETVAQGVYSAIEKWEDSFLQFCQLCTKYSFGDEVRRYKNAHQNLKLFLQNKYIPHQQTTYLQGTLYGEDSYISDEQMKQALAFASSGQELLLEYQMLLSAYEARHNGQNRQAVIDASSAVEICLVNQIEAFCRLKDIDPQILLRKYRTLGDRFALIAEIDSTFPVTDVSNTIVRPRNKVAHNNGVPLSDNEVRNLIQAVEQCLNHYHKGYGETTK